MGSKKGVDSLIVTDLIELARQKAISDAVLMSGDEDVRIGVQIAQNYGVRVHLLGIVPSRGSQARTLLQEADTTSEWDALTVAKFLSVRNVGGLTAKSLSSPARKTVEVAPDTTRQADAAFVESTVAAFVALLEESDLIAIEAFWKSDRGVPPEFDKRLLAQVGEAVGRRLERQEIRQMRSTFRIETLRRAKGGTP